MKIGIVGREAKKFTPETERQARVQIRRLIQGADLVISGRSPLGGIDVWAVEEAAWAGIPTREYAPKNMSWEAEGGFRDRNIKIAQDSDLVASIVVRTLPDSYRGRRFPGGCYHCKTPPEDHVKSGGCWTMRTAAEMGKQTELVVV